MGAFRERLAKRDKARADAEVIERFQRHVDKQLPWVERVDDKRELLPVGKRERRPHKVAEKRLKHHVTEYARAMRVATKPQKITGGTVIAEQVFDFFHEVMDEDELFERAAEGNLTDQERWNRDRMQDIKDNFVYLSWLQSSAHEGYRNLAVHNDYLGIRAALHHIAKNPHWKELLEPLTPSYLPLPERNDVIEFLHSRESETRNPERYIENAIRAVPGLYSAAHTLLTAYSETVEIEREMLERTKQDYEPTPLPTDADAIAELDGAGQAMTLPERRLEMALMAYMRGEGNINELPPKYGVSQKKFRKAIKERGLEKDRAGNWKQKVG